eukprot:TRINITY_DN706_c0_g1_i4.p1 TRINITY_DN706_c0_g1~~TRINITY_DN706_c0_g1_i4.p1  ORF type:complete len:571 (-),score=135.76 TRINITY_DN706_c0_g1_i4:35-1717(-)
MGEQKMFRSTRALLRFSQAQWVRRFVSSHSNGSAWNGTRLASLVGLGAGLLYLYSRRVECSSDSVSASLPEYSLEEVARHRTPEARIWVTYKGGVFDITEFIESHPGGASKIMLAAGGSIEPFWAMYPQHAKVAPQLLEQYRIGSVRGYSASTTTSTDPYAKEPSRHPSLRVISAKPFNAEPPLDVLADTFITPNDLFFKRNHLPVPHIDPNTYMLEVEGEGMQTLRLSLRDLQTKFRQHTVTATITCAGNRRGELNDLKEIKGLQWGAGAISNAEWTGVYLRDVLLAAGLSVDQVRGYSVRHVQFEGLDCDMAGTCYGASIPVQQALDEAGEVLLAWKMNGQPLPLDHGFPLRAIVPGTVGARHVKWLGRIKTSPHESGSHWQQKDYKSFTPSVDWGNVDWTSAPAIQQVPVNSAICDPTQNVQLSVQDSEIVAKGYAWSGGGASVVRVEVSADGGHTWQVASLKQGQASLPNQHNTDPWNGTSGARNWAWTHWQASVPLTADQKAKAVKENNGKIELCVRAIDSSYNSQPESLASMWNLRGVLNNAWHRIQVDVKNDD